MSSALELKKIYYCAALFSFTFSLPLYGFGLVQVHNTKIAVATPNAVVQHDSSSSDFIVPIGRLGQETKPATEFIKKSNVLLKQQLALVKDQNSQLQEQLDKRDKDVELIRQQIQAVIEQTNIITTSSLLQTEVLSSSWILRVLLLFFIASGGSYWYFRKNRDSHLLKPGFASGPIQPPVPLAKPSKPSADSLTLKPETLHLSEESLKIQQTTVIMSKKEELHQSSIEQTANPLKSKQAFDTLLDLAKTYITMADFDSANYALEEVQEYGTPSQKNEAISILLQLQYRKN